jgi:GT2 family glycosyltransferase
VVLDGLAGQRDAPPFELLVCANGDETVAEAVRRRFPDSRVWLIDRLHPGAARNILIENAQGEVLFFLDDDVVVEDNLLRTLGELLSTYPDAAVYGGPNATPPGSSRFQKVQGAVLASIVATGPVRRRYGRHPGGEADERYFTLCNLAIRRTVMSLFDTELVCAEENALLRELSRKDLPMRYHPSLVVYHDRRPTYRGFSQQMFKYGRGRGQILARHPNSVRPAFVTPAVLVAYLSAALPLTFLLHYVWALPAGIWLLAVAAAAAKVAASLRMLGAFPLAALQVATLHICYGAGVWAGLVRPGRNPGRGRLRAVKRSAREVVRGRLSRR